VPTSPSPGRRKRKKLLASFPWAKPSSATVCKEEEEKGRRKGRSSCFMWRAPGERDKGRRPPSREKKKGGKGGIDSVFFFARPEGKVKSVALGKEKKKKKKRGSRVPSLLDSGHAKRATKRNYSRKKRERGEARPLTCLVGGKDSGRFE